MRRYDRTGVPRRIALGLIAIAVSLLTTAGAIAAPLVIPVTASDGTPLGAVTVDVSADGKGVVGNFTSSYGTPPSLSAAAQKNGEHHWNWYQRVVRDNHPPTDAAGNPLTPPYDDPPAGGYPGQWADGLPWYWDEQPPPQGPATPGYEPAYDLASNITPQSLSFQDFPWGEPGTSLEFNTWLVSLNADGSIHSYHGGFSWTWDRPAGSGGGGGGGRELFPPVYGDQIIMITGPLAPLPEPGTLVLLSFGSFGLLIRVRRRWARREARAA